MNPLSTCDLCDTHRDDASGAFRVLAQPWRSFGALAACHGRVSTVQCFEDNSLVRAALEEPGAGRVLLVAGGGSMRTALVGGNLAALAARNGWAGVVVDGCMRDQAELHVAAVALFARALSPMPPAKHGQGRRDVAVQICGVWVRQGEFLAADADGIVVLPGSP